MDIRDNLKKAWDLVNEAILDEDIDEVIHDKEELGDAIATFHQVIGAYFGEKGCGIYPCVDPQKHHDGMVLYRHHVNN